MCVTAKSDEVTRVRDLLQHKRQARKFEEVKNWEIIRFIPN